MAPRDSRCYNSKLDGGANILKVFKRTLPDQAGRNRAKSSNRTAPLFSRDEDRIQLYPQQPCIPFRGGHNNHLVLRRIFRNSSADHSAGG